jgi:hypothetical protein
VTPDGNDKWFRYGRPQPTPEAPPIARPGPLTRPGPLAEP